MADKSIVVMLESGTWRLSSNYPDGYVLIIDSVDKETLKHNDTFILASDSKICLRTVLSNPALKHSASVYKWDSQAPS